MYSDDAVTVQPDGHLLKAQVVGASAAPGEAAYNTLYQFGYFTLERTTLHRSLQVGKPRCGPQVGETWLRKSW